MAIGVLFASAANALPMTLTLYGDYSHKDDYYDATAERGTLECGVSCSGLLSALPSGSYDYVVPDVSTTGAVPVFSESSADLFYLASDSEAAETLFVNTVLNTSLTGVKTDGNGKLSYEFTSAAMYILLKIGSDPNIALIRNTSGIEQTYTYSGLAGSGAGLSHIMAFGGPTSVPEPETALLLLPGIAAMALSMRRRKVAAA